MKRGFKERSMICPSCKNTVYPKISPVVIVAVHNGNELLMARNLDNPDKTRMFLISGFVEIGESLEQAVKREVMEELGVTDFVPERITQYVFESAREKELVFVHKTTYDGDIVPSAETDGGRFWTIDEIKANIGKGVFTPNFESEIERIALI